MQIIARVVLRTIDATCSSNIYLSVRCEMCSSRAIIINARIWNFPPFGVSAHRSSSHVRLVESLLKSFARNYAHPRTNLSRSIRSAWESSLIESNRSNRRSCVHSLDRTKQSPRKPRVVYQRVHVLLASIIPLSKEEISDSEECGSTRRGLHCSYTF